MGIKALYACIWLATCQGIKSNCQFLGFFRQFSLFADQSVRKIQKIQLIPLNGSVHFCVHQMADYKKIMFSSKKVHKVHSKNLTWAQSYGGLTKSVAKLAKMKWLDGYPLRTAQKSRLLTA